MKIKCPMCGRESVWEDNPNRPFCSERCRLIDLGAWVSEEYRVPGEKQPSHDGNDDEEG